MVKDEEEVEGDLLQTRMEEVPIRVVLQDHLDVLSTVSDVEKKDI